MSEKYPEIYKKKINNLKSKVQNFYYYNHEKQDIIEEEKEKPEKENNDLYDLKSKINAIFKKPNFVYQAVVNIMYKDGKNITKNIIGFKDNYLLTKEGEKININDIKDVN